MASALPPLRRQRPATDSYLARPPATRMRLPTDPLQRIIKLVGAVEAVYAPHPVSAAPPPRASSTLPPLRHRAASPAVILPAAPTPSSPRAVGKSKRLMLQHLEACFDSAEAAERTSVMLAEAQARTKLLSLCELPRESKTTPEQTRTPSPIRTRPGRVPARHIGKTRTATAYPVRRASVLEQHGRQAIEATEAKEWDWLVAVEKQARVQAEERSKLQRRTDTKQNRERDRKRCATAVVSDILEDAASTDDSRWELAQTLVHKSIASAVGKDAAEAALKAEKSSVDNQRHRYARALVDRLVASLVGRDPAPASRAA